jgi:hypothetical protein
MRETDGRTLEHFRAIEAKQKIAFLSGQSDWHPHGLSGNKAYIITANMWDCSPRALQCSEWGRLAGIV